MSIDFSLEMTDGLWLHNKLNVLLAEYGFFKMLTEEQKNEFDQRFGELAGQVLSYDERKSTGPCNGCGRDHPDKYADLYGKDK
jgi:hypothetical protein